MSGDEEGDRPGGGEPGLVEEGGAVVEVLEEALGPGEHGGEDREPEGAEDGKARSRKGGDGGAHGEDDDPDAQDDDLARDPGGAELSGSCLG